MIPSNDNFWLRQAPHISSIATLGLEGSSNQCATIYRIVDIQEHRFIDGTAEVTDF